jgi:hypothetical protein
LTVYQIDPISDGRWTNLLEQHPFASVFHSPAWIRALQATYGYTPVVYTTTPPGRELTNGWVFCRIHSWITGRRLVSLPFTDHCDVLLRNPEDGEALSDALRKEQVQSHVKYAEFRPLLQPSPAFGFFPSQKFHLHTLDLSPSLDQIFQNFHHNSTQRKIRRAEREGVTQEEGRSLRLLQQFYNLLVLTRRRHGVPPQPWKWFVHLMDNMADRVTIRVASHCSRPVAAILTLRFGDTLTYKYGCSDPRQFRLGGIHFLFWQAIQDAKQQGLRRMDLGRSDLHAEGLAIFKERWGATRIPLTYFRFPNPGSVQETKAGAHRAFNKVISYLPPRALSLLGNTLYRHFG